MQHIRFSQHAHRAPDRPAIIDGSRAPWTRGRLADATHALSRALLAEGAAPGQVLAILSPNCAEFMMVYLAATQIGLYVVPMNWHLADAELAYILEDCRPAFLVVHARLAVQVTRALRGCTASPVLLCVGGDIDTFRRAEHLSRSFDTAPLECCVQGRTLTHTSATTGRPKGVLLPLRGAERSLEEAIQRRIAVGTGPESQVFLCYSMLYHGSPLENAEIALHMGQVLVLADAFLPELFLKLVERFAVTQALVVPTLLSKLLQLSPEVSSRYDLSSLRRLMHGGAPCSPDTKTRILQWLGPIVWEAYGATEGSGTLATPEDGQRYPGTVGRPISGTSLRIVADDGTEAPCGTIGLVYLTRYTGERFEYLGDPEKTQAAYLGDHFTVGDLGYVNAEGFLFLSGRRIDMVCVSGTKIYPAEIENVLMGHPSVLDCAIFGVPDELTGEAVIACIQPTPAAPAERELKRELLRYLLQSLSAHKAPRHLWLVDELEREATGKVSKRKLRDRYLTKSVRSAVTPGGSHVA